MTGRTGHSSPRQEEELDLLVQGGMVVLPDGVHQLDVGVREGKIAGLFAPGTEPAHASDRIDARGKHVIPGVIDVHFHIRAPAYPERGTVLSETTAAAAGGVTTIFEMPITKPCCATPEIVRFRREHFAEHAVVNFALYGAPGLLDAHLIEGMVEEGVIGFKMFTTEAPKGRSDEFEGLSLPGEGEQLEAMRLVAEAGLPMVVHSESSQLVDFFSKAASEGELDQFASHGASRPPIAEAMAIMKVALLARHVGARLHVPHVTSREALGAVAMFRREGSDISAETCPQYLLFSEAALRDHGPFAKINPPLRSPDDQVALWQALREGTIEHVATDHSPFAASEKRSAKSIEEAPPGMPGVEMMVPAMLNAVSRGELGLVEAVNAMTVNGAKRFGIYPQKGLISEGSDADLAIVDLNEETKIERDLLRTAARDCAHAYEGKTFRGRVEKTLLAGKVVYDGEDVVGKPGMGKYVTPSI